MWFLWFELIGFTLFILSYIVFITEIILELKKNYIITNNKININFPFKVRALMGAFIIAIIPILNYVIAFTYIFMGDSIKKSLLEDYVCNGSIKKK